MKINTTNLDRYIEQCFLDAAASEDRALSTDDWECPYFIINGKDIFLMPWCRYERIKRRAIYRMERNMQRNFGLKLSVSGSNLLTGPVDIMRYDGIPYMLDRNYGLLVFKFDNRKADHTYQLDFFRNDEFLPSTGGNYVVPFQVMRNRFLEKNPQLTEEDFMNTSFQDIKELWIDVFGNWKPVTVTASAGITIIDQ